MLLPHVVEREIVQDDGSVLKRSERSIGVFIIGPWCDSTECLKLNGRNTQEKRLF